MKKTILLKLIGTYFIIIFLCIGIVGISLSLMFRDFLYTQKENELITKGKDIAEIMKPSLIHKEDPHDLINLINRSDLNLGTEVWVTDKHGLVIAAAANHQYCEGNALEETEFKEIQSGKIAVSEGLSQYYQGPVIRVTVPIIQDRAVIGAIIVYSPILGVRQAYTDITHMIIYAAIASLLVALIVAILFSRGISKPLFDIATAAIAIATGEKKVEVNTQTGIEEINQLGKTFNYMSAKIEENETRMKDFVANVSHELRSPLTSIKGFVEALLDNKAKNEDSKRKYLNIINSETDRLSKLISDLLILSRAEKIREGPANGKVDIIETLNEIVINLEEAANSKGIRINIAKTDPLPLVLFDANSLKQVIINLLENAIIYSPEGGQITIDFKEDANRLSVNVRDEGPGIPEEDLPNIWDRFYRVDKARSRETGGSGLGLAIVKQLVEQNGGTVDVNSKVGEGSVFSFTAQLA